MLLLDSHDVNAGLRAWNPKEKGNGYTCRVHRRPKTDQPSFWIDLLFNHYFISEPTPMGDKDGATLLFRLVEQK
jgi:hypothetical protein